jgi:peptidyl-prolyl cis-trans isomerase A (cyclophilin A)
MQPVDRFEERLPDGWYVRIETSLGSILARLHPEQAPQSVAHFAALAEGRLPWADVVTGEVRQNHYYDGLIVHRAVAGRRFEAGDPYGTGSGAPPIFVPPEVAGEVNFNEGGKIGLTRAPLGRISGAQFFVTAAPEPRLNPRHPCVATVVKGRDVAFRISSVKTYSNGKPIEPVTIHRVRIERKGSPAPLPEPVPYTPSATSMQLRR